MNALPFISLSALRSVATPADGAAVAEGGTDGDEGENGAFQPFLELIGLMAAPAAALPEGPARICRFPFCRRRNR